MATPLPSRGSQYRPALTRPQGTSVTQAHQRKSFACKAVQDDSLKSKLKDLDASMGFVDEERMQIDITDDDGAPAFVMDLAEEIAQTRKALKAKAKADARYKLQDLDANLGFLASEEAMNQPLKGPAPEPVNKSKVQPALDPDREMPSLEGPFLWNTATALLVMTLGVNILYGLLTGDI